MHKNRPKGLKTNLHARWWINKAKTLTRSCLIGTRIPTSQNHLAPLSGNVSYAQGISKLNYLNLSWQFMVVRRTIWKTELDLQYQVTQPLPATEKAKAKAFIKEKKNQKNPRARETRFFHARLAKQLQRGLHKLSFNLEQWNPSWLHVPPFLSIKEHICWKNYIG